MGEILDYKTDFILGPVRVQQAKKTSKRNVVKTNCTGV